MRNNKRKQRRLTKKRLQIQQGKRKASGGGGGKKVGTHRAHQFTELEIEQKRQKIIDDMSIDFAVSMTLLTQAQINGEKAR